MSSHTYSVSSGSLKVLVLFSTYTHHIFHNLNKKTLKNTTKKIKLFSYSQITEREKKYLVKSGTALQIPRRNHYIVEVF